MALSASAWNADDLTTWGDDGLLLRIETLRAKIAAETDPDVRTMLGFHLEDMLTEVRRRNEVRIQAIAAARMQ